VARDFRRIKSLNRVKSIRREKGILTADVLSSFIKSLAYHAESKSLIVKIRDTCYLYQGVTFRRFKQILTADSIGKAYNEKIKEWGIEYTSKWEEK